MASPDAAPEYVNVGGLADDVRFDLCETFGGFTPDLGTPHGLRLEKSLVVVAVALEGMGVGHVPHEDVTRVVCSMPDAPGIEHLGRLVGINFEPQQRHPAGPIPGQTTLF